MLKVHLKSNVSQLKVIFFYIYGLGKNKRIWSETVKYCL
jgi:hypothetical protein